MVFFATLTILQAGVGCALLATLLVAQRETFVASSDVSVKISTEQTSYKASVSA